MALPFCEVAILIILDHSIVTPSGLIHMRSTSKLRTRLDTIYSPQWLSFYSTMTLFFLYRIV